MTELEAMREMLPVILELPDDEAIPLLLQLLGIAYQHGKIDMLQSQLDAVHLAVSEEPLQ